MKFTQLPIEGVFLIECIFFEDNRGKFIKTFNFEMFREKGITDINFKEIYYSISQKNTIRGMHFQIPPFDHAKLIYLTAGKVIDVLLDLRKNKKTFGKYISIELSAFKEAIYIPRGLAHGFRALEDGTTMVYNQTSVYNKAFDTGILYNSFGYDWGIDNPVISQRDLSFKTFEEFNSPF